MSSEKDKFTDNMKILAILNVKDLANGKANQISLLVINNIKEIVRVSSCIMFNFFY